MGARVEFQRIAGHDLQPARIVRRDLLQCGDRALIALDGDDAPRPLSEQRARQAARPGADLDDGRALKWAARTAGAGAATRLAGSALPVPVMSKAVPWSGEVRKNARPRVTLTARSKASVL